VREAIDTVRPYAVDVCSGVEAAPGKKDWQKVREFIAAAKTPLHASYEPGLRESTPPSWRGNCGAQH
jgi:hypothetical protein